MSVEFELHPRLLADTHFVGDLELGRCLLMNDARYPWLLWVPRIPDLTEVHHIPQAQRLQAYGEIEAISISLEKHLHPHKINVAALGNQVPQLHVHIIARQTDDAAWPGPVWGVGEAQPYDAQARDQLLDLLRGDLIQGSS